MSGLKRPYSDEEGDDYTDTKAAAGKRKLVSTSDFRSFACASPWNTASPLSASCDRLHCNDSNELFEPSPIPCLSSPSSGELLDVPGSIENYGIHGASTSISDSSEFTEDSRESEICFGMVSYGDHHTCLGSADISTACRWPTMCLEAIHDFQNLELDVRKSHCTSTSLQSRRYHYHTSDTARNRGTG